MYVTKRNIAVYVILTLVTCGIWGIVWFVQMVDDINALSGEPGAMSGIVVFLLSMVTCGIYMFYWMYKAGEKLDAVRENHGLVRQDRGVIYLLLSVFGLSIVAMALIQNDLNVIADVNMGQR